MGVKHFAASKGIATKLLGIFTALVIVPAAIVSLILMEQSQRAVRDSVLRDYEEIAVRTAGEIGKFLERPIQSLAETAEVISLLRADPWKQKSVLGRRVLNSPLFTDLYLADTTGKVVVSCYPGYPREKGLDPSLLREISDGRPFVISKMFLSEQKLPFATLAVPVEGRGRILGVLVSETNLRGVWDLVDSIRIGKKGHVYVVSPEGSVIAHPDKKTILRRDLYAERTEVQAALRGERGSREYRDPEGKSWLGAYAPVPDLNWGVIVEQPTAEAYAFARTMRIASGGIVLVALSVALLLGITLVRSMVRPIQELVRGTHRIAEGRLDHHIDLVREDEIGVLADSFNRMVTSLRDSRQALEAAKNFNERIVENAPVGILTVEGDHAVTSANPALIELLDLKKKKEILGRRVEEIPFFRKIDLEGFLDNGVIEQTVETEQSLQSLLSGTAKVVIMRKVTLNRGVRFASNPAWQEGPVLILIEDITEQRRTQQQLLQSEKLAGLGQLAAGVAHELRNPLSIVSSGLHLVNRLLPGRDPKVSMAVSKMERGIKRSQQIITNLLDFSRPASRAVEWVDTANILNQVLLLENKAIARRDIEMVRKYSETSKVRANLDSMRQVFLNMVNNAIQSMPEGGTLTLGLSQTEDGYVMAEISDTGEGISQEHLKKIFDPFFTTKEPGEGTGLGLAIVHREIERHGGRITVESKVGVGTKFSVFLPIKGQNVKPAVRRLSQAKRR